MRKLKLAGFIFSLLFSLFVSPAYAILGDIDGSGTVDGNDLALFSLTFGSDSSSPKWTAAADLAANGLVDGVDLSSFAPNFGMNNGTGSVAAEVKWGSKVMSKSSLQAPKVMSKVGDIDKVFINISGASMTSLSKEFFFNARTGLINDVPAGTGLTLTVTGKNASGTAIYRGTTLIDVEVGKTTNVTLYATEVVLETAISPVLAGGHGHSLVLTSDGNLWGWGLNDVGQLGDGTFSLHTTPSHTSQLTQLIGVTAVDSESLFSIAIKYDGTVWAWGDNECGQLGNGEVAFCNYSNPALYESSPVQVTDLSGNPFLNVTAVQAGSTHAVALKNDGTVWTWGDDSFSQLGDSTTGGYETSPVQVKIGPSTFLTGIDAISAGGNHTLALKNNSTVWAWGHNGSGELGDGTQGDSFLAIQVSDELGSGYLSGIISVSAGAYHSVALANNSTVWAWGDKDFGQVGNTTHGDGDPDTTVFGDYQLLPVQVVNETDTGPLTGIKAIATGDYFTLALKADGTVVAWGRNDHGQLGDGTRVDKYLPTTVSSLTGVVAIFAGDEHAMALKADNTLWTWGSNEFGQLGNGSVGNGNTGDVLAGDYVATPTQVLDLDLL